MLGIGLLALLTAGVAFSLAGGDDDMELDTVDNTPDTEDEVITPIELDDTLGDDFNFVPAPGTDPEIVARVNDLVAELRVQPGLEVEDAVAQIEAFIEALEAEAGVDAPITNDEDAVIRPPSGDQFNDPSLNPPQVVVPGAAEDDDDDEIVVDVDEDVDVPVLPTEPTATPEELVTVTRPNGTEFADDSVLAEGPTTGQNADRDYIVSTGIATNNIDVGYDPLTTFLVQYSDETNSVTASLNSDIDGPAGGVGTDVSTETDENGTEFTEVLSTRAFTDSAEITMNVSAEQIGVHVAQIDLQNPDDSLHFEFDADVTGNLHLVFNDAEEESASGTLTIRTLYVIETPTSVSSITAADIAQILLQDGDVAQETQLLAEINLGFDSVNIDGDPDSLEPYQVNLSNFINDDPIISTNIEWASIGENDGSEDTTIGFGDFGLDDLPFFNPIVF